MMGSEACAVQEAEALVDREEEMLQHTLGEAGVCVNVVGWLQLGMEIEGARVIIKWLTLTLV